MDERFGQLMPSMHPLAYESTEVLVLMQDLLPSSMSSDSLSSASSPLVHITAGDLLSDSPSSLENFGSSHECTSEPELSPSAQPFYTSSFSELLQATQPTYTGQPEVGLSYYITPPPLAAVSPSESLFVQQSSSDSDQSPEFEVRYRTCKPCRSFHRHCDRQQPICALCIKTGRAGECEYPPPSFVNRKKRKTRQSDRNKLWLNAYDELVEIKRRDESLLKNIFSSSLITSRPLSMLETRIIAECMNQRVPCLVEAAPANKMGPPFFVFANKAMEEIFGYRREDLSGSCALSLISPKARTLCHHEYMNYRRSMVGMTNFKFYMQTVVSSKDHREFGVSSTGETIFSEDHKMEYSMVLMVVRPLSLAELNNPENIFSIKFLPS